MNVLGLKENLFLLPSLGQAYDLELLPLIDGTSVKIKPFVAGDQRYLAKANDAYQGYYSLLTKAVTDPAKGDFSQMLVSDVIAILFAARLESIGPEYPVKFKCESCESMEKVELMLNEVQEKMADEFSDETSECYKTNGFQADGLEIEFDGQKVTYHLPRLRDEKQINSWMSTMKNQKKLMNPEMDRFYVRYAQLLDTVDGTALAFTQKFDFICQLSLPDFQYFGQELGTNDVGIQGEMEVNCTSCGYSNKAMLGLTGEFFHAKPRTVR